jgi:hypothetical protein
VRKTGLDYYSNQKKSAALILPGDEACLGVHQSVETADS